MEDLTNGTIREFGSKKHPLVRIIGSALISLIALFTGAAIVHGLVLNQCQNNHDKKDFFVAGVVPEGVDVPKADESKGTTENGTSDLQKCVSGQTESKHNQNSETQTGPQTSHPQPSTSTESAGQPSVQGFTPAVAASSAAPAPKPQADVKPEPQPKPAPKPAAAAKTPVKAKPSVSVKSSGVNLDKLSIAVAMTETHNCQDTKGAALVNNCHGFKKNGKFMKFSSPAESHAYFKQLWAKSYKIFPTYRLAQIYSGNDHPSTWLKNVTYYYYHL